MSVTAAPGATSLPALLSWPVLWPENDSTLPSTLAALPLRERSARAGSESEECFRNRRRQNDAMPPSAGPHSRGSPAASTAGAGSRVPAAPMSDTHTAATATATASSGASAASPMHASAAAVPGGLCGVHSFARASTAAPVLLREAGPVEPGPEGGWAAKGCRAGEASGAPLLACEPASSPPSCEPAAPGPRLSASSHGTLRAMVPSAAAQGVTPRAVASGVASGVLTCWNGHILREELEDVVEVGAGEAHALAEALRDHRLHGRLLQDARLRAKVLAVGVHARDGVQRGVHAREQRRRRRLSLMHLRRPHRTHQSGGSPHSRWRWRQRESEPHRGLDVLGPGESSEAGEAAASAALVQVRDAGCGDAAVKLGLVVG